MLCFRGAVLRLILDDRPPVKDTKPSSISSSKLVRHLQVQTHGLPNIALGRRSKTTTAKQGESGKSVGQLRRQFHPKSDNDESNA